MPIKSACRRRLRVRARVSARVRARESMSFARNVFALHLVQYTNNQNTWIEAPSLYLILHGFFVWRCSFFLISPCACEFSFVTSLCVCVYVTVPLEITVRRLKHKPTVDAFDMPKQQRTKKKTRRMSWLPARVYLICAASIPQLCV